MGSETPATPLGARPPAANNKSGDTEDLELKVTIMRDMIAAHEKTIAQLQAEKEEATRAKEAANAEHSKTKQELAKVSGDKEEMHKELENIKGKLADSLTASAKQRQEHQEMMDQVKQKLSEKFNMNIDDLLNGSNTSDDSAKAAASQKQSGNDTASQGLSDKEREKYERVIAELNAENQKLKKQLEQQQQESEKTIAELRDTIADLQFKVDHAASEIHQSEPETQPAPTSPSSEASPLFARSAKPEVKIVKEKVIEKDPQDELKIKELEVKLTQEKAMYTKHIKDLEDQHAQDKANYTKQIGELEEQHARDKSMYTKRIEELEEQLKKIREDDQQKFVSQHDQYEHQISDIRADYEKQLEALRQEAAEAAKKAAENKKPEVDTDKLCADERQRTLLAVVRAMNDVLSREAYTSVLSVKPASEEGINEQTCAGKAQELAEIAKSLYDRAAAAAAGNEAARKSSSFEMSLLKEENEKIKKDNQELQRRYDALARQKMADQQNELKIRRLELENKQLRMELAEKEKDEPLKKTPRRGTIQVAGSSDSSEDDIGSDEEIKRNLLRPEDENSIDNGNCQMKKWLVALIMTVIGLVCLGVGGGVGFVLAKQLGKGS